MGMQYACMHTHTGTLRHTRAHPFTHSHIRLGLPLPCWTCLTHRGGDRRGWWTNNAASHIVWRSRPPNKRGISVELVLYLCVCEKKASASDIWLISHNVVNTRSQSRTHRLCTSRTRPVRQMPFRVETIED